MTVLVRYEGDPVPIEALDEHDIDEAIRPLVYVLNRTNMLTVSSCAGHERQDHAVVSVASRTPADAGLVVAAFEHALRKMDGPLSTKYESDTDSDTLQGEGERARRREESRLARARLRPTDVSVPDWFGLVVRIYGRRFVGPFRDLQFEATQASVPTANELLILTEYVDAFLINVLGDDKFVPSRRAPR